MLANHLRDALGHRRNVSPVPPLPFLDAVRIVGTAAVADSARAGHPCPTVPGLTTAAVAAFAVEPVAGPAEPRVAPALPTNADDLIISE